MATGAVGRELGQSTVGTYLCSVLFSVTSAGQTQSLGGLAGLELGSLGASSLTAGVWLRQVIQ